MSYCRARLRAFWSHRRRSFRTEIIPIPTSLLSWQFIGRYMRRRGLPLETSVSSCLDVITSRCCSLPDCGRALANSLGDGHHSVFGTNDAGCAVPLIPPDGSLMMIDARSPVVQNPHQRRQWNPPLMRNVGGQRETTSAGRLDRPCLAAS